MRMDNMVFVQAAAVWLALLPGAANAQCVVFEKPEELFAFSDAVFTGTVLATEQTGARGTHVIVSIATLRVERSWKGDLGREVRVGADMPFERGKRYVVFANGKPLSTSILCRAAERIERAKPKLRWLSKRRSKRAG